jgi:hypothetical protein
MSAQSKAQSSKQSAASSTRGRDLSVSFNQSFRDHFPVRLHMTVLLSGVLTSGLLFSKLLFEFGMHSMWARYLIAVSASYAVFFLLIKVWLWCVTPSPKRRHSSSDVDILDPADLGRLSGDLIEGGASVPVDSAVSGHGGDFGGGGATDVWGYQPISSSAHSSTASAGASHHANSGGGSGGGGFDLGDEAVVLIALALLALAIFGAGAYLVYAAPEILSEAAFQALLAAGLIKASNKMTRQGWMGSVLRATCVPFLIVLLMTGIFGWVAHENYPHATRLADIFKAPPPERR